MIIGGHPFDYSREYIERVMRDVEPEDLQVYGVEIEGRMYPPKQVIATVLGVEDRYNYTTAGAQRVLGKKGFRTRAVGPLAAARGYMTSPREPEVVTPPDDLHARVGALEAQIAVLQEAVASLKRRLDEAA